MPFALATTTIEEQEKFLWSGYTRADIDDVYDLFQRVNRADNADHNQSVQDLTKQYADSWFNPLTDARVIRNARGELVAFARVLVNPKPTYENVAFLECDIAPEARGQDLDEDLLEWMQANARHRLAQTAALAADETVRTVMRAPVPAAQTQTIALYNAHGFEQVRAFYKMQRDLREPIPDAPLPEGFALRVYDADIDEKLFRAFNESFGDHWGFHPLTRAEWEQRIIGDSALRRDLSFVVMTDENVAAFCLNCERAVENERLGIRRGWTTKLGTRRAWRKRGLATFLLAESMRQFRAQGFDYAGLGVDATNLTGALALYEGLGYRAYKTRYALEKLVR